MSQTFDIKKEEFSCRVDRENNGVLKIYKCEYCGKFSVVQFHFENFRNVGTYEGHIEHYGHQFIAGGRTSEGTILCDSCLNKAHFIDEIKELEHKRKNILERLREISLKISVLYDETHNFVEKEKILEGLK